MDDRGVRPASARWTRRLPQPYRCLRCRRGPGQQQIGEECVDDADHDVAGQEESAAFDDLPFQPARSGTDVRVSCALSMFES